MKKYLEALFTYAFNTLFSLLKNKENPHFSREEIRFFRHSFSQFGEDIALNRRFGELNINKGIYLDVGAFHPILLSNTLLLHKKGWSGINIDINEEKIKFFKKLRPLDQNLALAIAPEGKKFAIEHKGKPTEKIIETNDSKDEKGEIKTDTLNNILEQSPCQNIDYLNIDCEGYDFEVLKTLSLEKYHPSIITIEAWDKESEETIVDYLKTFQYKLAEKIHWTLLFTSSK